MSKGESTMHQGLSSLVSPDCGMREVQGAGRKAQGKSLKSLKP
jgi:hypothetical protein